MLTFYRYNQSGLLLGQLSGQGLPVNCTLVVPPADALPTHTFDDEGDLIETLPPAKAARWTGYGWELLDMTPEAAAVAYPDEAVPDAVSPRQIRQAMNRVPEGTGTLREAVEAAVATGSQDLKDWWEFSAVFERKHPQVVEMTTALGKSEAELDALWRLAATL